MELIARLFLTFAKIGLIGFGGGMAILPLIYQSVSEFNTIDPDEFANLFAISQATPGPLAVNAATFTGFETAGIPGALAATVGVAFPAFILVAVCVKFLNKYQESKLVQGAFLGIRPVAVGMIMAGFIMIAQSSLMSGSFSDITVPGQIFDVIKPVQIGMAAVTFIAAKKFKVNALTLILVMGVLGAFLCKGELI